MHRFRLNLCTLATVLVLAATAVACQVPVFRYALERWTPDRYEVIVLHAGPLTTQSQAAIERLQSFPRQQFANFDVHVAEVATLRDERLLQLWQQHSEQPRTDQPQPGPLMVVLYPRTAMEVPDRLLSVTPLATHALQAQGLESLITSPVRQEVARRLSSGQSAVWIFVPSGDAAKDSVALKTLTAEMAANKSRLTLPTAEELEIDPQVLAANKLPLKIDFSVVTLDRQDPREAFLLQSLEQSELDLPPTEPLAFPVLGRGRVLYALVGKGIMPATIDTACTFIVGPCSCQVKNQNPGFDLLLSHDWESATAGSMISSPLPDETAEPKLLTIPPGRSK